MAKGPKPGRKRKIKAPTEPTRRLADTPAPAPLARPSSLLDTRVIYCGDNLEQLKKLPDRCPQRRRSRSERSAVSGDAARSRNLDGLSEIPNGEVFWGETKEKRSFEDRHASTQAYIDYMRPRCVELARVLKKTGSFYYHCDWHVSHYVKVMLWLGT